jgi:PhnB protein
MKLNTYLGFDGQCKEAFEFYAEVLGGKITFMTTWGETPSEQPIPEGLRDRIMHATLAVGDSVLMGADPPSERYERPKGASVSIHLNGTSEGERVFNALAGGGTVRMPFMKTFWSPGFGMCVDRFGTPWMVNCEREG